MKYLFVLLAILHTPITYSYLISTLVLKHSQGTEVILYSDDYYKGFDKAQKQIALLDHKLSLLKRRSPRTKVWYEGLSVQGRKLAKAVQVDSREFLYALDTLNIHKKLGLQCIDTKDFFIKSSVWSVKALYGDNLRPLIQQTEKSSNSQKPEKITTVKQRIAFLQFAQSYPPAQKILSDIHNDTQTLLKHLESTSKKLAAQSTIAQETALSLNIFIAESRKLTTAMFKELTKNRPVKDKQGSFNTLMIGVQTLINLHFVLECLSNTRAQKHILFAQVSHIADIADMLKKLGFTVIQEVKPQELLVPTLPMHNEEQLQALNEEAFNYIT